ncbi:MAG: hypothetical protein WA820_04840 [Bradyrhizobium sp.]|jgi:hypothetical protein
MNCQPPATTVDLVRVSEMIDGARALIFDVDGTLAETEALLSAATGKDWAGRFELVAGDQVAPEKTCA